MLEKRIVYILMILLVGSLLGCDDKAIETVNSEDDDNGSKGVLYEVTYDDNTAYLFGTLHFSDQSLLPLNEKIEEAYRVSDYLAVEINPATINRLDSNRLFREIGMYPDGTTIKDTLSDEVYERLTNALDDIGINEEKIESYKPWAISDLLLQEVLMNVNGVSYDFGMDTHFISEARSDSKRIIELETFEEKMNVYLDATHDLQEADLNLRLLELNELNELFQEEKSAWVNGDIERMEKYRQFEIEGAAPEDNEAYFDAFYLERDRKMAGKIEELLISGGSESYFVAVGAYHLVGEGSIVELLGDKGYDIKKLID